MLGIGVGSIPILSATLNAECRVRNAEFILRSLLIPHFRKGVIGMSREQILKLTSLSSCAG